MPAESTINLLDQPEFESSSVGKLLTWAITYGRYIMIGTEIIVLLAFISRFSLDRSLTDLREEIAQKQIILQANESFESDFSQLQLSLTKIRGLLNTESKPIDMFYQISALLPADVTLSSFSYDGKIISIALTAGTTDGFSTFLSRLQGQKGIGAIDVTDVEKDILTGIHVRLDATLQ